jgi:hypothetical protein
MLTAIALDSEMTARAVLRRLARNGLCSIPSRPTRQTIVRSQGYARGRKRRMRRRHW